MITVNDDNIMISQGDVINKYFYVPGYTLDAGDKFYFTVSKIERDGSKTVKLNVEMQPVEDEAKNCFLYLDVTSEQTKNLQVSTDDNVYAYDVHFVRGQNKFALNYVKAFVVKGVAHNV